jgi:hypothetical protein
MKRLLVFASLLALSPAVCVTVHAQTPSPVGNHIKVLSINKPPCKVLSAKEVIRAKIVYRIAATEQSPEGFAVSIKFQGNDPRFTFSAVKSRGATPPRPDTPLALRSDTLTLTYSMADILQDTRLMRPITCYFYLHRNLGNGRSTVIAQTPPIVFSECQ